MNAIEKVIAPCHPSGRVDEAIDGFLDNDSKEAWCQCALAKCCVGGNGHVLATEFVFQIGGPEKVKEKLAEMASSTPLDSQKLSLVRGHS